MRGASIVVLTGMSGSGKSVALRALEDNGFFCIDNLPVSLLPKLLELSETTAELGRIALVMDTRETDFVKTYHEASRAALEGGYRVTTVFLDASDEVLQRRFSETRRKHPINAPTLAEAIRRERQVFDEVRGLADHKIDTTSVSVRDLRRTIQDLFNTTGPAEPMHVSFMSFGFKHGVPTDANLVIDVRFLPNPFYIPELKDHTGLEEPVAQFVLGHEASQRFLDRFGELLAFLLPYYEKEGRHYLTIAVGCTGGVHRSVAIVEALVAALPTERHRILVTHRELNRHRVIG